MLAGLVMWQITYPRSLRADVDESARLAGGAYLDLAYLWSNLQPANGSWRSKSTSAVLDELSINNATALAYKNAYARSRWGFLAGLQAGSDVDALMSDAAVEAGETLKHLYYTNASYLFPWGAGLLATGGLISGHLGYESFWALDNPTYTRTYGADLAPYFHWGLIATFPHDASLSGALLVVNGYDYLASPNSVPSYGLQLDWKGRDDLELKGNIYYGPEQEQTTLEYWRFVGEVIAEWRTGDFVLAADIGFGTEQQAIPGTPRLGWAWGAAWIQWRGHEHWRVVLRPEFFVDDDGLMTGSQQTLGALTGTLEYQDFAFASNRLSVRLEYRYDYSTGPDGGFYSGQAGELNPHQHLLIGAITWHLDSGSK